MHAQGSAGVDRQHGSVYGDQICAPPHSGVAHISNVSTKNPAQEQGSSLRSVSVHNGRGRET